METYFCLLRGINVSGHNKIKIEDLKNLFLDLGYQNIITYIQSGNVIFSSEIDDVTAIEQTIKQRIADKFSLNIEIICKSQSNFEAIVQRNPFSEIELKADENIYFTILSAKPDVEVFNKLSGINNAEEEIIVLEDTIYSFYKKRLPKTVLTNSFIEKTLKKRATTRNLNTMNKLVELGKKSTI